MPEPPPPAPPPDAPEAPPPRPNDHPGRTAFLRVLMAAAVFPVLFAVGAQLPADQQDPVMMSAIWLVGLLPLGAVVLGIVSLVRGQSAAGWGYLLGALVAGVIGFGSCAAAILSSL